MNSSMWLADDGAGERVTIVARFNLLNQYWVATAAPYPNDCRVAGDERTAVDRMAIACFAGRNASVRRLTGPFVIARVFADGTSVRIGPPIGCAGDAEAIAGWWSVIDRGHPYRVETETGAW